MPMYGSSRGRRGIRNPGWPTSGRAFCDSVAGRFLSIDPALESADPADPQTWNRYTDVLNNPLSYRDPDGESPSWLELHEIETADVDLNDVLSAGEDWKLTWDRLNVVQRPGKSVKLRIECGRPIFGIWNALLTAVRISRRRQSEDTQS